MSGCKLALWQGAGVPGDLPATVAEVARVAGLAAGADLLVFPEGFLTGYHIPGLAPGGLPGVEDALAEVGAIAAQSGLTLVMGTHTDTGGALHNSAVVFDGTGAELGRYHKRTLFGGWEQATFVPGDQPLTFTAGGLRVGVAICYDVEFPELIRAYAREGVQLVVVPTALMAPHDRVARLVVPVRALENQIFLGYANRCGQEPGLDFVGLSCICGPRGQVLAETGTGSAMVSAQLDPAMLAAERAESSYLDDLATFRLV
ncbi:carbon-nitrogen hydrolase family protein [Pararhodobacter sp. SW119]|uniref:carbon-nitrogen hydrolase family protein n=1 Tax=Pararhodobacter sp. SW119 TaxID=2780075 RepID=UPI001ADEC9BB|nr:carbon-nitrogen hydrolase family protein [Pararhodobacter sp. SW119]